MIEAMPTFYLFVLAALGAGLLPKGSMRAALLLLAPVLAALPLLSLPAANRYPAALVGQQLQRLRLHKLSPVTGLGVCIAAFSGNL